MANDSSSLSEAARTLVKEMWDNCPDRTARTQAARDAFRSRFASEEERRAWYRDMALTREANRRARRAAETPDDAG